MRILYVTNGFPYPLTSGYLRHYFLIRELSKRHSITLFSLVHHDFREEHVAALRPFTDEVVTFRRSHPGTGLLRKAVNGSRMLAGFGPAVRNMWNTIEESTQAKQFDVAFFSGKVTLPPIQRLGGVPVVADICDAGSVRIRGRLRIAGLLQTPLLLAKYFLMRRFEKSVMQRTSHSVFASGRDRDALTSPIDPNATIVPNGVDLDYWTRSSTIRGMNTIVFTGAMHYAPNADAALHLIQDIFPRVQSAIPQAELLIVGRDPVTHLLHKTTRHTGITVTGYVDDMRPYLERATVFAAPLRFAAGIQNKLLEAMAMEMQVIASPAAAAGVQTEDGREAPIEIAEGAPAFARSIICQLQAGLECPASNQATREYVQQYFSWSQAAKKLEHVLCRAAGRESLPDVDRVQLPEPLLRGAAQ